MKFLKIHRILIIHCTVLFSRSFSIFLFRYELWSITYVEFLKMLIYYIKNIWNDTDLELHVYKITVWLRSLLIRIVTSCILKSLFPTFNSVSFNSLLWKCIESVLIKRTSFSSLISKWFCNWVNDITMIMDESLCSCFIYWQDLTVITRSTELSFVTASIVYFSAGGRRVWHWD